MVPSKRSGRSHEPRISKSRHKKKGIKNPERKKDNRGAVVHTQKAVLSFGRFGIFSPPRTLARDLARERENSHTLLNAAPGDIHPVCIYENYFTAARVYGFIEKVLRARAE